MFDQNPPKPAFLIHSSDEPVYISAVADNKANMPLGEPLSAENYGGQFHFGVSGTSVASSGVSLAYTYTLPTYIPDYGPLPSEEMKLQHIRKNMDQAEELV